MVATPRASASFPVPRERQLPADDEAWTRLAEDGWCYPGEAACILGISNLDYRQLRVIYELVRKVSGGKETPRPLPKKRPDQKRQLRPWARYTLRDLACAAEVVRLCVTPLPESPQGRARLNVAQLDHACERLMAEGMSCPLLEVRFDWSGKRLVASSRSVRFDAKTGQILMERAEAFTRRQQATRRFDERLARVIRTERAQIRRARAYKLSLDRRPPRGPAGNWTISEAPLA